MDEATKKLAVLLDYLIKHNAEHADEINDIAAGVAKLGNETAQKSIENGVDLLLQSNEALKKARKALGE